MVTAGFGQAGVLGAEVLVRAGAGEDRVRVHRAKPRSLFLSRLQAVERAVTKVRVLKWLAILVCIAETFIGSPLFGQGEYAMTDAVGADWSHSAGVSVIALGAVHGEWVIGAIALVTGVLCARI